MKCKVSGKKITPFMSFGKMPMANGFLEQQEFNNEFVVLRIKFLGKVNNIINELKKEKINLRLNGEQWSLNII